ncbi:transglutaminase domain-containing protein [Formosa sp. S-31]|uniref:transglutaminase domain-containing protein n=1 Tax=Formosa sp. S-31 TaxID=2790949 RepID=UPI003EBC4F1E
MKTQLINLLLFLTCFSTFSQSFNSQEFKVSRGDLETNVFTKDSTANAIVLYEYGDSYIDAEDFNLKTEYKRKVKILNKNGFDYATIIIPLYNKEYVKEIQATTYNLKNNMISSSRLDKKDIYYEEKPNNYTYVKFTLPNVQEGSVITLSYRLSSPYIFKYHEWFFQEDIPKLYSEYDTSIPGIYHYNIKLVGPYELHSNDSKIVKNCLSNGRGAYADCAKTKFVMKDIPAFIEEDYITSKSNYISRIDFELKTVNRFDGSVDQVTKTWESVDHELKTDKSIGSQIRKSVKPEDLLSAEIINEKDPLKKAKAIYAYVQDNYKWDGDYKIFSDVSIKDLIKTKSGNVSSINILLNSLLEECGIESNPVLLSTRENGFPTKLHPVISDFNYLIVQTKIGGKTYKLDATESHLPFGSLPFRCLNGYGRKIDFKAGSEWVDIEVDKPSVINHRLDMEIKGDSAITKVNSIRTGYYAIGQKKEYLDNKEAYKKSVQDAYPSLEILDHTITEEDRNKESFTEDLKFLTTLEPLSKNEAGTTQKTIYLNPVLFKFFKSNPFQLQERNYPIDFGYKIIYSYTIKINTKGYTVSEIPQNVNYALPNGKGGLIYNITQSDDDLIIYLKFNFKEPMYSSGYYESLKQLASELVNIQNNSLIVLNSEVSI